MDKMNGDSNYREFDRFYIEFEMEVVGENIVGKKFREKTVLKDISGGGALFVSKLVENYFLGQPLELTINLPGTGNATAFMEGNAKVVRIIQQSGSDMKQKNQEISVAVTLDKSLQLGTSFVNS